MARKYVKKRIPVEAEQFRVIDLPSEWLKDEIYWDMNSKRYYCDTLEGKLFVSDKDWIIQGIKGECYPVKPDIFEASYEKVDD